MLLLPPKPADQSRKALENLSPYPAPTVKQSLGSCWTRHFSQVTWPPLSSGTTSLYSLQYRLHPSLPHFHPLPPLPFMLLTVARRNEREGTWNKSQTLYWMLSPAYPLTSFYNAPAALETLLPQHLCTCCSFLQEDSSPRSFIELPPL